MMSGFEVYQIFQCLKLHFTSKSYDYFKYRGKTKVKLETFEKKHDKYYFYKLSKKYITKEDLVPFFVSNFIKRRENLWIGELVTEEAETVFKDYSKKMQSLSYIFTEDCKMLFGNCNNPNDILRTKGEYPVLLLEYMHGNIQLETVCILNILLNFLGKWKSTITDDIICPTYYDLIEKYSPFLNLDLEKYKTILKRIALD